MTETLRGLAALGVSTACLTMPIVDNVFPSLGGADSSCRKAELTGVGVFCPRCAGICVSSRVDDHQNPKTGFRCYAPSLGKNGTTVTALGTDGTDSIPLAGYGEKGEGCMSRETARPVAFHPDGKLRYRRFHCKSRDCPYCWRAWARKRKFALAVDIEFTARVWGKRPYKVLFSKDVAPIASDVRLRLMRRGYRWLEALGLKGWGVFHPYRIKPDVLRILREEVAGAYREGVSGVAYWDFLRLSHLGKGPLQKYFFEMVNWAPHVHTISFTSSVGSPSYPSHRCFRHQTSKTPEEKANVDTCGKCRELQNFYVNVKSTPIEDVSHLVRYLGYLLSHASSKGSPARSFGINRRELREAKRQYPDVLDKVKYEVALEMGMEFSKKITEKNGVEREVEKLEPLKQHDGFLPISDLDEFLAGARLSSAQLSLSPGLRFLTEFATLRRAGGARLLGDLEDLHIRYGIPPIFEEEPDDVLTRGCGRALTWWKKKKEGIS